MSPFTTVNYRELSAQQLSNVLGEIHRRNPSSKIILSCAPNDREQQKMGELIGLLDFTPWRVFSGSLDLMELTALIQKSRLHLGGDTGSLHIAWMCGTPSVIWFRHFDGLPDWRPISDRIRSFVGNQDEAGIRGINNVEILEAVEVLLDHKRGEIIGQK